MIHEEEGAAIMWSDLRQNKEDRNHGYSTKSNSSGNNRSILKNTNTSSDVYVSPTLSSNNNSPSLNEMKSSSTKKKMSSTPSSSSNNNKNRSGRTPLKELTPAQYYRISSCERPQQVEQQMSKVNNILAKDMISALPLMSDDESGEENNFNREESIERQFDSLDSENFTKPMKNKFIVNQQTAFPPEESLSTRADENQSWSLPTSANDETPIILKNNANSWWNNIETIAKSWWEPEDENLILTDDETPLHGVVYETEDDETTMMPNDDKAIYSLVGLPMEAVLKIVILEWRRCGNKTKRKNSENCSTGATGTDKRNNKPRNFADIFRPATNPFTKYFSAEFPRTSSRLGDMKVKYLNPAYERIEHLKEHRACANMEKISYRNCTNLAHTTAETCNVYVERNCDGNALSNVEKSVRNNCASIPKPDRQNIRACFQSNQRACLDVADLLTYLQVVT